MSIANNKKAFHDFFIEDQLEAGLVLEGWEVKAIRAGRVQLKESYIYWKKDAFYLAETTSYQQRNKKIFALLNALQTSDDCECICHVAIWLRKFPHSVRQDGKCACRSQMVEYFRVA